VRILLAATRMLLSQSAPLILGSASPRRRDILSSLRIPFRVVPAAVDESAEAGEDPARYLVRIVPDKLAGSARAVIASSIGASGIVVADTIVVVDGEILGKPRDRSHAEELLIRLLGRTHDVMTRYAISVAPRLAEPRLSRTVESRVTMRSAGPDEVERYAATGEGLDKAGAYAAQGIGAFLISRIEGSFTNVVGLPACELVEDLLATGLLESFPISGTGLAE